MSTNQKVMIVEPRPALAALIVRRVAAIPGIQVVSPAATGAASQNETISADDEVSGILGSESFGTFAYSPLDVTAHDYVPNLAEAGRVFKDCARNAIRQLVLISSASVYGADYHNPGLIRESRSAQSRRPNRVAESWRELEATATRYLPTGGATRLTILRPVFAPIVDGTDWISRLFKARWAWPVAGFNPTIQVLAPGDLAEAVGRAIESGREGVFNVAPHQGIPLRRALRAAGVNSCAIPWTLQRLSRKITSHLGCSASRDQLEYLRYSSTACNSQSCSELQVDYRSSSLSAVKALAAGRSEHGKNQPSDDPFDEFGMDKHYVNVGSRRWLGFLDRCYWRIEVDGLEHIPRTGRAVLAGVHRGFMPFDGVMLVHLLAKRIDRIPRFLIHPGLIKYPFLAKFLTKLGGIIACQDNADYVLQRNEMLGIFPEGIRGAFRLYRDAYTLGRFGRYDFVKMALMNRAPIVPFLTLGTAEMFPILGKLEWSWWKRTTEWPFFPITPTFPLLPVPLPTKWHFQFLPAIHLADHYPPEAAADARIVQRIGEEIRAQMQLALTTLRERRRSIFYGSIFGPADGQSTSADILAEPIVSRSSPAEHSAV